MSIRNHYFCFAIALALFALNPIAHAADPVNVKALTAKAKTGDANAQYRLGVAYDYGRGVPQDAKAAMKWYRTAADQGHAQAQNSVGSLLQADKKYAQALPWYQKAAAQGNANATNNLAYFYDNGLAVAEDPGKAFTLYSKAADMGWAEAMWNLSGVYGGGRLGKPDLVMACVWNSRAAKHATPKQKHITAATAKRTSQMQPLLSAAQRADCKQRAAAWTPPLAAKNKP